MVDDFGPVPVSRLKEESASVYAALHSGRRVLISRRGDVVVAIDPADPTTHAFELARFAIHGVPDDALELSASLIGQGSPSEFIRKAEEGQPAYVTKDGHVYGFLKALEPEPAAALPADVAESFLAKFEAEHPEATPEELDAEMRRLEAEPTPPSPILLGPARLGKVPLGAAASKNWVPRAALTLAADDAPPGSVIETGGIHEIAARTAAGAIGIQIAALAREGRAAEAEQSFDRLVTTYGAERDVQVTAVVSKAMLTIGELYVELGRTSDAIRVSDLALKRASGLEELPGD